MSKKGLVEKKAKKYFLTQKGKVIAGNLDIESLKIGQWGKASVAIAVKKIIKGKKHILMQQRLKEPFYGKWGFINGKIRFGESSDATVLRELKEETGLTGKPEIVCVYHKLRGPSLDNITLDNFFFVYIVRNPKGKLVDTKEGHNKWFPEQECRKLDTFPRFKSALDIVTKEKYHPYFEEIFILDNI